MATETMLGKIERAEFGVSGYQDACIGLFVTLSGSGWGVNTDKSMWDANAMNRSDRCKWTEEDRDNTYSEIVRYVSGLLNDAKVKNVSDLKGIPVEATFEGGMIKSWRILTEVL